MNEQTNAGSKFESTDDDDNDGIHETHLDKSNER